MSVILLIFQVRRRSGFITCLSEMAGSKSSLCVRRFWVTLLIFLPPFFFCRGDLDVCLLRRQMEFGQRGSAFWLNMCVFLQCLLPSDCTVDLSAKAWHCCWQALTLQSIVYLWKCYYVLNIYYSSLVLKVTLCHKIALRFQSFEEKLFFCPRLSVTVLESALPFVSL